MARKAARRLARRARALAATPRRRLAGIAVAVAAAGIAGYASRPDEKPAEAAVEEFEFGSLPPVTIASRGGESAELPEPAAPAVRLTRRRPQPSAEAIADRHGPYAFPPASPVLAAHYERTAPGEQAAWLTGTIEEPSERPAAGRTAFLPPGR
ncbi:MAG: hypothetical protein WD069_11845 [Planctomycetales bacterium]